MAIIEQKEKRYHYINVKVKPDTYERLISTKGFYEMQTKRRLTMDDIIRVMLDSLPEVEITAKAPKRVR